MIPVFADTEYWIALNSPQDDLHPRTVAVTRSLKGRLILTSEVVLTEFLDGCAGRGDNSRRLAATFVRGLHEVDEVRILPQTSGLFGDALALYESRADKKWSMTDCASIVLCHQESIADVLTHDYHFVQAGFRALLRPPN